MAEFVGEYGGQIYPKAWIPTSGLEAANCLRKWAGASRAQCQNASKSDVLQGWHALAYLFPGLHPEDGISYLDETEPWPKAELYFPHLSHYGQRCYSESEWPTALKELLVEMWRRYENGVLTEEEFYYLPAQKRGILQERAAQAVNEADLFA